MLRGKNKDSLLRQAWGKSLNSLITSKIDIKLVKNLFNLFEIIVVMCVTKFKKLETEEELGPLKID